MKLPIKVPETFRIIAHRGASAYAPENTLSAFKLALQMGVHEIEIDTQLSLDRKVVICHDITLEKYGYGSNRVENMRWAELADLDMGSWFSPFLYKHETLPVLEGLFQEFYDTITYHIEIKGKAETLPEAIYAEIQKSQLENYCIITSFSYNALLMMRTLCSTIRLGWLVEQLTDDVLTGAQQLGLYQICLSAKTLHRTDVDEAHKVVKEVRAWNVNGSHQEVRNLILKIIDAGCDGMTINWPDWVTH